MHWMESRIQNVLSRFENVDQTDKGQWMAKCPCHNDKTNSLAIGVVGQRGLIGIHCHAGCDRSLVMNQVGLADEDLFPPREESNGHASNGRSQSGARGKSKPGKIVATYDYHDEAGRLLYQSVRFDPKDFRQRAPLPNGGWQWTVKGVRRVLYKLPDLLSYIAAEQSAGRTPRVYVAEGEKDVDRLWSLGLAATTNVGGASKTKDGKSKWSDEYSRFFQGCEAVVLRDNDEVGCEHSIAVGRSVHDFASVIKVIDLPGLPAKGDVSDWLDAGGTVEQLSEIVEQASVFVPPPRETQAEPGAIAESDDDPHRLARSFLKNHIKDGHITIRYWRSEWWKWSGKRFERMDRDEIPSLLTLSIKSEFDRIFLDNQRLPGIDEKPPLALKVTRARVNDTLNALKSLCLVPGSIEMPCWLSSEGIESHGPNCIAMANGILDLDRLISGEASPLRDHSPDWFSSTCLNYPFELEAECPKWLSFLSRVMDGDQDRITLLQEWAGYLLLPDTSQQKFMALEGEGANGKSVYLAALTAMLGNDSVSHIPLERFSDRFALTESVGKLANIAADVGEIDKVAEGHLKSFTSGDPMFFDRKGIPGFTCVPTARLMLAFNNRPRFSDRSAGIWRRMILIPFQVTIGDDEKIYGMDKVDWWKDSGELPGIFHWAVFGLYSLRKNGRFSQPSITSEAIEDYKLETNPARAFLLDHYGESETCRVPTKEVYQKYKEWCRECGYHPLSERIFGKEVRRVFPKSERRQHQAELKREWNYFGIGIIESSF